VLDDPSAARACLDAAYGVAVTGLGVRIEVLAACSPATGQSPPTSARTDSSIAQPGRWDGQFARLRAIYEEWIEQRHLAAHASVLIASRENLDDDVLIRGRRVEFIVLPSCPDRPAQSSTLLTALFRAGRPVVLVPPHHHGPIRRDIAIVWRDDEHTVKAILSALPLLFRAVRISLVVLAGPAGPAPGIPEILLEHRIPATLRPVVTEGRPGAEVLVEEIRRLGPDLVVMGAPGKSIGESMVADDLTQLVIDRFDLPVLMQF
jgi:nucleotide-binding universal stress UspA family protein